MNQPRKRPGLLWMFFYGRQRRGIPWLLLGLLIALLLLGLTFAIPGVADAWRGAVPVLFVVLILGAIVAAVAAWLRPRRRH